MPGKNLIHMFIYLMKSKEEYDLEKLIDELFWRDDVEPQPTRVI